jgi:DNA-binding CsgD family transcriptional regulator
VAAAGPAFRGRSHERDTLDRLVVEIRQGRSAALVIRGEAGIGKTALLRYCAAQATGCQVAEIAGFESELELPFAALHQLCAPMLEVRGALPQPQALALDIAFGTTAGTAPDRFLVGLAVLTLLAEVASNKPLVCLIDDAQWLDEASRHALQFVGRRLLAESVLLIFAVRAVGPRRLFPDLRDLTLSGLADEDARALIDDIVSGPIDAQVRNRIVAETGGNPLGLLELPRGMTQAELRGGFRDPTPSEVTDHIEEHYRHRVSVLPAETRQLMLVAAADPTADASLVLRAARALGIGLDAATAAAEAGLLEVGSDVRFRHPLVRSASYALATPDDRSAAHLALAAATDPERDPERRVWHRAAAATGYDEEIASELEQAAATVQGRAGLVAAAAFFDRAAALSPDPRSRTDRALAAVEAHLQAGAFDEARGLLAEARWSADGDLQQARVEQLNGQVEAAAGPGRDAPARLLHSARQLESLDAPRARETYLQAWWAALLAGQFAPPGQLLEISRAARLLPQPADPTPCDLLLEGLATLITEGRPPALAVLRKVIGLFVSDRVSDDDWIQWGRSAATAAAAIWDFESWIELSTRQVDRARASGALTSLVISLNFHANMLAYCGNLEEAAAAVAEQEAAREATGIRIVSYGARLVAAHQGHLAERSPQVVAIEDELMKGSDGYALQVASLATALLNNGRGQYSEAIAAAQDLPADFTFLGTLAFPEVIEASVRGGRLDVAHEAFQRLSATIVADSDWAAGIDARGRALMSEGEQAEHWYLESIACLARTPLRPDLFRSRLLYGEWLRRQNRRVDSREQLRAAYEAFLEMGTVAFAERARRELVATGEKVRKRAEDTRNDLTAQEQHIARLARDGRTNSEIATELFISVRTVEWHLRKVYIKLGVTSRKELKSAMPSQTLRA